jgi:hypothetical protein
MSYQGEVFSGRDTGPVGWKLLGIRLELPADYEGARTTSERPRVFGSSGRVSDFERVARRMAVEARMTANGVDMDVKPGAVLCGHSIVSVGIAVHSGRMATAAAGGLPPESSCVRGATGRESCA